jgi:hypothetical protein
VDPFPRLRPSDRGVDLPAGAARWLAILVGRALPAGDLPVRAGRVPAVPACPGRSRHGGRSSSMTPVAAPGPSPRLWVTVRSVVYTARQQGYEAATRRVSLQQMAVLFGSEPSKDERS